MMRRFGVMLLLVSVSCLALFALSGCDAEDLFGDDYFSDEGDSDLEGSGPQNGSDLNVICSRERIWRGPPGDVQFFAICQGACTYEDAGFPQGVDESCSALGRYSGDCVTCD